jgi:alpha-glucuronidase
MVAAKPNFARRFAAVTTLVAALLSLAAPARSEDGYRLWLRYDRLAPPARAAYAAVATEIVIGKMSPTTLATANELHRGLSGRTGRDVPIVAAADRDGAVLLARAPDARFGDEGFRLRSTVEHGRRTTRIEASTDHGLLYGSFALLRRIQTRQPITRININDHPRITLRMLDPWDNADGSIERGYAGRSLWDWSRLPGTIDPRITDYARVNASVGINAVVLNNVNAKAEILTAAWLTKVAALADALRPWGIRIFLSARFSAPIELGGLPTADPQDAAVRRWWKAKADEICTAIPDFGGFLVKASSEGQPGPQDYGRSHADGANMLAAALAPHGGVLIWRAFVYSGNGEDRAKQAFAEFQPLDGQFAKNVVVQVKNGPINFQPREPFHPLFGAMPRTSLGLEVQITKEYLGFNTHLAYLAPMWEEVLRAIPTDRRAARPLRASSTVRSLTGR